MFADEMVKGCVLGIEIGLLDVTGICGAFISTYVFLACDRFDRH
jgi:hypothetical protein